MSHTVPLPELHPKMCVRMTYGTKVPRRYEETNPVLVQSYTHRSILDLGEDFHSHLLKQAQKDRDHGIKAAEEAMWTEARKLQQDAVDAQAKELDAQHEKTVCKLNKTHQKQLEAKLAEQREASDRQKAAEFAQLQEEADRAQREAVQNTEQLWQTKLLQAVDDARRQEQQIAAENAACVAKVHAGELQSLQADLTMEMMEALARLAVEKDAERKAAVEKTCREHIQLTEQKLEHLHKLCDQQVRVLHSGIKDRDAEVGRLRSRLEAGERQREEIQTELRETRAQFQRFIDLVRPFNHSESRYLIPPISSFPDIESFLGKVERGLRQARGR